MLPAVEEFTASIGIAVEGEPKATGWTLRGRVKHAVRYHEQIDLGRISDIAPQKAKQSFPIYPLVNLENLFVRCESQSVKVDLARTDNGYLLAVEPVAGLARMSYHADLKIIPVEKGGRELPTITVPVRFEVGSDMIAVPDMVNFGIRKVGECVVETVNLQSISGRKFTVTGITTTGEGLSVKDVSQAEIVAYEIEHVVTSKSMPRSVTFAVKDEVGKNTTIVVTAIAEALMLEGSR